MCEKDVLPEERRKKKKKKEEEEERRRKKKRVGNKILRLRRQDKNMRAYVSANCKHKHVQVCIQRRAGIIICQTSLIAIKRPDAHSYLR